MKILKYAPRELSQNFSGKILLSLLIVFSLLVFITCNSDEDKNNLIDESSIEQIVEALGGEEIFNQTKTLKATIDGALLEYEQELPTEANPVTTNTHRLTLSSEFTARKARMEYEYRKFQHPFKYDTYGAKLIVNDKKGSLSGEYNWSAYYFGTTQPIALHSSRIEATLKNLTMANPLALLHQVLSNGSINTFTKNNEFIIPTRVSDLSITLAIDPNSHLPLSASIMEADHIQGDVLFEVVYEDWVATSGLKYPSRIVYNFNGELLKTEDLSNIELGVTFDAGHFTPEPADQIAYSEENADNGIYYSQWYHRWSGFGILLDQPLDNGAMALGNFDLSSVGITSQEVGPNLKVIGRPDTRTWSVVAKTNEGLVIFDAPINSDCTRSGLNTIRSEYPGEPVLAGVISHLHHDHCGGMRELIYETETVYVGPDAVAFTQKSIDSKHTLRPDNLELDPKPITVKAVTGVTKLGTGPSAVEIHLLDPEESDAVPHADEMVFMYVPEYETIVVSDQIWLGGFMDIWDRLTHKTLTPATRAELRNRSIYLRDYVQQHGLTVSKIVATHGGLGTYETLVRVAQ